MEREPQTTETQVSQVDIARNQFIRDQLDTEKVRTRKGDRFEAYVGFVQGYAAYIGIPPGRRDSKILDQLREAVLSTGLTSRDFQGIKQSAQSLYRHWAEGGRARYITGRNISNAGQDPNVYYGGAEHRDGLGDISQTESA